MWLPRPSFTKAPTQKSSASMLWVRQPPFLSSARVVFAVLMNWLHIRLMSFQGIGLASILCMTTANRQETV